MNFPTATDQEWNDAHRIIRGAAVAHGINHADAEDMAQETTYRMLRRRYAKPPEGPVHAARIAVRQAKRFGFYSLLPRSTVSQAKRDQARPAESYRPHSPDPAQLAQLAERQGIPLSVALERVGVGLFAMTEPDQGVYGSGIRWQPPREGCPGLHGTDPNPASRAAAALAAANDLRRVAGLPPA